MNITDAIFALAPIVSGSVGVWYGGKITMKSALEARQHEDRRADEKEIIDLRAASRLVDEQLSNIKIMISRSLEDKNWYRPESSAFNESVWAENRSVLARLLDEDEWLQVTEGVDTAIGFGRMEFEGEFVHESQIQLLTSFKQKIEQSRDVLRHHRAAGSILHAARNKPR